MDSTQFILGQLTEGVDNLTKQVTALNDRLDRLNTELDSIKLFRAKVVGASLVVSAITSGAMALAVVAIERWAR